MRTTKLVTVSISPDLLSRARKIARFEGRTQSELFREALRQYLASQDIQTKEKEEAREQVFILLERVWRHNKHVPPEVIEEEVKEAIQRVRKQTPKRKRSKI